jgi:hypothetical protein
MEQLFQKGLAAGERTVMDTDRIEGLGAGE